MRYKNGNLVYRKSFSIRLMRGGLKVPFWFDNDRKVNIKRGLRLLDGYKVLIDLTERDCE